MLYTVIILKLLLLLLFVLFYIDSRLSLKTNLCLEKNVIKIHME